MMEEVPHYSDDMATSPDSSPHQGRRRANQRAVLYHQEEDFPHQEGRGVGSYRQEASQSSNVVRVHQSHEGRTEFRTISEQQSKAEWSSSSTHKK